MTARVLLADDHPILLQGLRGLIERDGAFTVVGTASTGAEALEMLIELRPELAVLDLNMPLMSGLDVLRRQVQLRLTTRTVMLVASASDAEIVAALDNGAAAVLFKDEAPTSLIAVLQTLVDGKSWQPGEVVALALARERGRQGRWRSLSAELTSREREVVESLRGGHPNKEIAHRLDLSEGTVKVHVHNIFRKLGVTTRNELVALIADAEAGKASQGGR
jgi:two-component system nitrate/nitrite response regulator NarL